MTRITGIIICFLLILHVSTIVGQRTFLDKFAPVYRVFRQFANNILRNSENTENSQLLKRRGKSLQLPSNTRFPCNLNNIWPRSKEIPRTAHEVRPGDIDVIAAIGDSLTVAYGASANSILQVFTESRGKSFSMGGEGTWRTQITLPNILKVFNPNLIGYSLGTSISTDRESQFNVAEVGAISAHMPYMAKVLVDRLRRDPRVNINRDWKLITMMIGDNDFCTEICYTDSMETVLKNHIRDLLNVLRIFRDNLPRTIVNVIPPPHLMVLTLMSDKPSVCQLSHIVACPCIVGLTFKHRMREFFNLMQKWQLTDIVVANSPEFDRDDFTVIPHNFTLQYTFPKTRQGGIDYTYLSEDCFHFSEKGQARFANDLWNSMLEPFDYKSNDGSNIFSRFRCPSEKYPFIFTRRNSPRASYG